MAADTKPDMPEEPKLESSSVPEIYFDIIARIIPGALIFGLFGLKKLSEKFGAGSDLIILFIASYLTGIVLGILAGIFWGAVLWIYDRIYEGGKFEKLHDDGKLWLWIRKLPANERNRFTKMMAELNLFCSLSFGALLMLCCQSSIPSENKIDWRYLLAAFVIFSFCMIAVYKWLLDSSKSNKEKHCSAHQQHINAGS